MADTETIHVAEVSAGPGGGEPVTLPVVEVLTGRGFVTGKSGSGKSNTASVVAEKLLSANFPILIVDTDGEYYGLKEKFEILHVGADEECDIHVSPEHAGKIAELALEENVPIILDISSFLDEDDAKEMLTSVAKQLFAKEKKLKKPFLMIVEEVHEYIPEGGGLDECGRWLIKIGKRGRKHGLGIAGISQRPADVKKDFITQCDWLTWHRLTWGNDTKVVGRILGSEYADAVEGLDDGEAFLRTDWSERIRRVQFHRKQTFDAGATPGLDDFERPELKSVSGDLVADLQAITEEERRREDELERLRAQLEQKEERIADLEAELADARDMSRMADQFAQAMLDHADGQPPQREQTTLWPDDDTEEAGFEQAEIARTDVESKVADQLGDQSSESDGAVGNGALIARPEDADRPIVRRLRQAIADLDVTTRRMLTYYRSVDTATPIDAQVAAGGTGERSLAYSRNRDLRMAGLVRHAGRGEYEYAVPALVTEEHDDRLDDAERAETVEQIERAFVPEDDL